MSPLSQFFLRQRAELQRGPATLWLNPPGDLPWREFDHSGSFLAFSQDHVSASALRDTGAAVDFGVLPQAASPWQRLVITLPREKQRLDMLLRWAATALGEDGECLLAGEIRAGAKSAAKRLQQHFVHSRKIDNARHCVLYSAHSPRGDQEFCWQQQLQYWPLDLLTPPLQVASLPGVFAQGALDAGSQLLLETLAQQSFIERPRVLDLGCGSGVLGCWFLRHRPAAEMVMTDSSALALAATRATLKAARQHAQVLASDGLRDVQGRFDLIISNPPFHVGHQEQKQLSQRLFAPLRDFLKPGGRCIMVANRHLNYHRWLEQLSGHVHVLAQTSRFQVFCLSA